MRKDAEKWFSEIHNKQPIRTKFDLYYFCLMIGLATGRKSEPTKSHPEFTDFTDDFVSDYKPYQRLIIGLLIRAELSRLGVSVMEKDEVRRLFVNLVNPQNPTNLTDMGMNRLNEYSSGGYDYLAEKLGSKPYDVSEFIRAYVRLLHEAINHNSKWEMKDDNV
jgi:hypothetical protein